MFPLKSILDCPRIISKLPIGLNNDNSFYLGDYYEAGDYSEDQINEIFNKHVTNEGSKSCGGGNLYCPGDEILISPNQGSFTLRFQSISPQLKASRHKPNLCNNHVRE